MPEPVHCERCGAVADVDWCDIRKMTDPGPVYIMGHSSCTTPGCVNEHGSTSVLPPDRPGELTRTDRLWLRFYERRLEELKKRDREFLRMLEEVR